MRFPMLLSGLAIVGLACGVPLVHARSLQQASGMDGEWKRETVFLRNS